MQICLVIACADVDTNININISASDSDNDSDRFWVQWDLFNLLFLVSCLSTYVHTVLCTDH